MRNLNKYDWIAADEAELAKDTAVSDEYQGFSGELLRLALLGLTGYGLIVGIVNTELKNPATPQAPAARTLMQATLSTDEYSRWAAWVGLACFAVAACTAIAHRYCSGDAITHMIRRCRLKQRLLELRALETAPQATQMLTPNEELIRERRATEDARIEGRTQDKDWTILSNGEKMEELVKMAEAERTSLYKDLSFCEWLLSLSAFGLGLGAVAIAFLFGRAFLHAF